MEQLCLQSPLQQDASNQHTELRIKIASQLLRGGEDRTALPLPVLQCTTIACIALYCYCLYCTALLLPVLHCTTTVCITLHYHCLYCAGLCPSSGPTHRPPPTPRPPSKIVQKSTLGVRGGASPAYSAVTKSQELGSLTDYCLLTVGLSNDFQGGGRV